MTGRVIIDTISFERCNPSRTEVLRSLEDEDYIIDEAKVSSSESDETGLLANDYTHQEENQPKLKLTPEAHLICRSTVKGYSLKLKKWRKHSQTESNFNAI